MSINGINNRQSHTNPQIGNRNMSGSHIHIVIIAPTIIAMTVVPLNSQGGIAPAKNTVKITNNQYNMNMYTGKNNIVIGQRQSPKIA